jgi:RNA polymerase sigma-70 factor (ECF subfamily)
MLGSVSEAEDVVQEALLRLSLSEEEIEEPAAWITTVSTRLSIDTLRQARARRETYIGPWLPEPLVEDPTTQPSSHAEMEDSISQAFLVMLERLSPVERAAFLLREVFEYDYARIAQIVGRSEQNCRQIVTRARKHLESEEVRFDPDEDRREELLQRFLAAAEEGDVGTLEEVLAEDAVLYSDGGGRANAARKPLLGAARIAKAIVAIGRTRRRHGFQGVSEMARVNGQPGRVLRTSEGEIEDVLSVDVVDGRIQTVRVIRNPDKLAHV